MHSSHLTLLLHHLPLPPPPPSLPQSQSVALMTSCSSWPLTMECYKPSMSETETLSVQLLKNMYTHPYTVTCAIYMYSYFSKLSLIVVHYARDCSCMRTLPPCLLPPSSVVLLSSAVGPPHLFLLCLVILLCRCSSTTQGQLLWQPVHLSRSSVLCVGVRMGL